MRNKVMREKFEEKMGLYGPYSTMHHTWFSEWNINCWTMWFFPVFGTEDFVLRVATKLREKIHSY